VGEELAWEETGLGPPGVTYAAPYYPSPVPMTLPPPASPVQPALPSAPRGR
jgi:hypothetical protein